MAVSSQLFELIQNLTVAEKRHFKMFANIQEGEKNYLKLFEFVSNQEVYDEEAIKAEFEGETFINSLHVTKNYLVKLILKSLKLFHSNQKGEIKLYNLLLDFHILDKKGLYEHAREVLGKIKKLSLDIEYFNITWWVVSKELSYLFSKEEKKLEEGLEILCAEILEIEKKIDLQTKSIYFFRKNTLGVRNGEFTKPKDPKVNEFKEELSAYPNLPVTAEINFLEGLGLFKEIHIDYEGRFKLVSRLLNLWKSHPFLIDSNPQGYKITLANYLNSCFRVKRFDEFPRIIKEINELPTGSYDEEGETFQNYAFYELLYLMNVQNFEDAKKRLPFIEEGIIKYKRKIHKAREIAFYYNVSILHFLMWNFEEALDWINKILQFSKTEHRQDLQRVSHLLQLIYHFEIGNQDLLFNLVSSVQRKLSRKKPLNMFEEIFFNNFNKLLKSIDAENCKSNFLSELEDFTENHKKGTVYGLDETIIWLKNSLERSGK